MKAIVNTETCIGSGTCKATCPKVFDVVEGKSEVKTDPVSDDQEACVHEAVEGCPVGAIFTS